MCRTNSLPDTAPPLLAVVGPIAMFRLAHHGGLPRHANRSCFDNTFVRKSWKSVRYKQVAGSLLPTQTMWNATGPSCPRKTNMPLLSSRSIPDPLASCSQAAHAQSATQTRLHLLKVAEHGATVANEGPTSAPLSNGSGPEGSSGRPVLPCAFCQY